MNLASLFFFVSFFPSICLAKNNINITQEKIEPSAINKPIYNSQAEINSMGNFNFSVFLMAFSLVYAISFYVYHMFRITKDINPISPLFDIAEVETKIDFTIAEREDKQ